MSPKALEMDLVHSLRNQDERIIAEKSHWCQISTSLGSLTSSMKFKNTAFTLNQKSHKTQKL